MSVISGAVRESSIFTVIQERDKLDITQGSISTVKDGEGTWAESSPQHPERGGDRLTSEIPGYPTSAFQEHVFPLRY